MKRTLLLFSAAALLLCFTALPALADFTDDCVSASSDGWHRYHGLTATPAGPAVDFGWSAAPDRTALALTDPSAGAAYALYAVDGAQGVEVSLYSVYATFATRSGGVPVQGYPSGGSAARAKPLLLSEATGRVYLQDGGWYALERDSYGEHVLTPLPGAPSGALASYGLTVSCSQDGKLFSTVPVSLRSARCSREDGPGFACYYETYFASVPSGTRFIRAELREVSFFPLVAGGTVTNTARGSLRLASVSFTGNAVRGALADESPSSAAPGGSSSPAPSEDASSRDPDLQTSSAQAGTGGNDADDAKEPSSRSSRSSAVSSRSSSAASSRASSSRPSAPRSSTKGASVSFSASSAEAAAPENASSPQESEPPLWEEHAASPREADSRTLLLGGGYLVFAALLLVLMARKK